MFVRLVKMNFHKEHLPVFFERINSVKAQIRNFPGNNYLEIYQDKHNPCIVFTYSIWSTEEDLENYRQSALFREVWTYTKQFFKEKPEAWSIDKIIQMI